MTLEKNDVIQTIEKTIDKYKSWEGKDSVVRGNPWEIHTLLIETYGDALQKIAPLEVTPNTLLSVHWINIVNIRSTWDSVIKINYMKILRICLRY
jgi:hypothetical protein